MDDSKEGSSPLHVKVDSCTIKKTAASSWSFRLAWAPIMAVNGKSAVRYDVQFVGKNSGKRHTFRTADDTPGIVLPNRLVREKVGDEFTVHIRTVLMIDDNVHSVGEWSEVSSVLSVAKPSPSQNLMTATPRPSPTPPSPSSPVLEALPYGATRKVPAKPVTTCGNAAKRQRSVFERLMSGFRRPMVA